jgi:hypothetical protein
MPTRRRTVRRRNPIPSAAALRKRIETAKVTTDLVEGDLYRLLLTWDSHGLTDADIATVEFTIKELKAASDKLRRALYFFGLK